MWGLRSLSTSLVFLLIFGACHEPDDRIYSFSDVDQVATYPGGLGAFNSELMKSIKDDMKAGIISKLDSSQRLFVQLVVDRNGQINVAKVISSTLFRQEEELKQSILKTKKWSAAHHQGNLVAVSIQLPIKFVGSNGDKNYLNQCIEIAKNQNLDDGYILVIPQDGCSGCVTTLLDFAINNFSNPSLRTIITGFKSTKDILVFQQNHIIPHDNNLVLDSMSFYTPYLPDRLYPLVIRIENKKVTSYEVLSGSVIETALEKIQLAIRS